MAERPGLTDDQALVDVIAGWRRGQAQVDARVGVIRSRVLAILDGASTGAVDPDVVVTRLRAEAARLVSVSDLVDRVVADAEAATRTWLEGGGLARIYEAGAILAGYPFEFTAQHVEAVEILSRSVFDDVLSLTSFVPEDAKAWVARVAQPLAELQATTGASGATVSRRLERRLRAEFRRRGMGSVVYRNGSRHGFGEYADMLLRTKSAMAYNVGTITAAADRGVQFVEVLDGPNCGWVSHNDPDLANGKIVPIRYALAVPIAHPNCVRAWGPRPDLERLPAPVRDPGTVAADPAFTRAVQAAVATAEESPGRSRARRRARTSRRPQRA